MARTPSVHNYSKGKGAHRSKMVDSVSTSPQGFKRNSIRASDLKTVRLNFRPSTLGLEAFDEISDDEDSTTLEAQKFDFLEVNEGASNGADLSVTDDIVTDDIV